MASNRLQHECIASPVNGCSSPGKNQQAASCLQGERPLSHRSSQRADALRQLRELWLSEEEAEQPGTPDLPRGSEAPCLLHAAATACNGHSSHISPPHAPSQLQKYQLHQHAAASLKPGANHLGSCKAWEGASSQTLALSNGVLESARHAGSTGSQQQAACNGDSQPSMGDRQEGHALKPIGFLDRRQPAQIFASLAEASDAKLSSWQHLHRAAKPDPTAASKSAGVHTPTQRHLANSESAQDQQGNTEDAPAEALPVSVAARTASDDKDVPAKRARLPDLAERSARQLHTPPDSSASSASEIILSEPDEAYEPAWVSGFRGDMRLAIRTPIVHPPEHSTPGASPAVGPRRSAAPHGESKTLFHWLSQASAL